MNSNKSSTLLLGFKAIYLLLFMVFGLQAKAQDFSVYAKHIFETENLNLPYRLLKPIKSDSIQHFPLIIFLHGANAKGNDNEAQLQIGGRFFMRDSIRNNYPAYVLFPQCPQLDLWVYFDTKINPSTGKAEEWDFTYQKNPTEVTAALKKLIDSLVQNEKIDASRIYIAGLSQGGMGVLDMIARYPDTFAAGISICGAGNSNMVKRFSQKVALRLFHGDKDDVVPVSFSQSYFKKLQKLNADVRYTEYPDVMHNSWVKAFNEPDFLAWLFSKHKERNSLQSKVL